MSLNTNWYWNGAVVERVRKKQKYYLTWIVMERAQSCTHIPNPHLHAARIILQSSGEKNGWWYNRKTLKAITIDCEGMPEGIALFQRLVDDKLAFNHYLDDARMEDLL